MHPQRAAVLPVSCPVALSLVSQGGWFLEVILYPTKTVRINILNCGLECSFTVCICAGLCQTETKLYEACGEDGQNDS